VGRKHVATLMRRMGIEALYRKKSTSKPHPEHVIYPYLGKPQAFRLSNTSSKMPPHLRRQRRPRHSLHEPGAALSARVASSTITSTVHTTSER
jgi:hypothetical protein